PFLRPQKSDKLIFRGFNVGRLNQDGFQGRIELLREDFEYISEEIFIDASYSNMDRKTVHNHLLSSKKRGLLGSGYSGSVILSSNNKLKGLYFASIGPTKKKFKEETKFG